MRDSRTGWAPSGAALSDRGFWAIFCAAWIAYAGLYVTAALGEEGMGVATSLGAALANTLPPAGLAVILALRRRDLLRPERSLTRTVLTHAGVGLLFAVATATGVTLLMGLVGWQEHGSRPTGPVGMFLLRVVGSLFLYAILDGFLMWAESIRRVHESRALAAREAMLRAQAEAKSLRAQFNPHFVFNTLHSLMLLVRADPATAERAIEDVAELIRYASVLQRRDVDLVPLAKELEVARRYVALERLRLEDRLRVVWEVEVDPAGVLVPAFALQTLLDNAVRHGLETRPEGGTITVGADAHDDVLALTVADDGEGARPEVVAMAAGHGLQLLARRLEALYGDVASVSWTTAPGQGFTATVRFPLSAPQPTDLAAGSIP